MSLGADSLTPCLPAAAAQNLVDTFIVSQSAGTDVTLEANMVDFPAPSYTSVGFWGTVANFYGIFMVIAILYPISNVIRGLVTEKGQRPSVHWSSLSLNDKIAEGVACQPKVSRTSDSGSTHCLCASELSG